MKFSNLQKCGKMLRTLTAIAISISATHQTVVAAMGKLIKTSVEKGRHGDTWGRSHIRRIFPRTDGCKHIPHKDIHHDRNTSVPASSCSSLVLCIDYPGPCWMNIPADRIDTCCVENLKFDLTFQGYDGGMNQSYFQVKFHSFRGIL